MPSGTSVAFATLSTAGALAGGFLAYEGMPISPDHFSGFYAPETVHLVVNMAAGGLVGAGVGALAAGVATGRVTTRHIAATFGAAIGGYLCYKGMPISPDLFSNLDAPETMAAAANIGVGAIAGGIVGSFGASVATGRVPSGKIAAVSCAAIGAYLFYKGLPIPAHYFSGLDAPETMWVATNTVVGALAGGAVGAIAASGAQGAASFVKRAVVWGGIAIAAAYAIPALLDIDHPVLGRIRGYTEKGVDEVAKVLPKEKHDACTKPLTGISEDKPCYFTTDGGITLHPSRPDGTLDSHNSSSFPAGTTLKVTGMSEKAPDYVVTMRGGKSYLLPENAIK